MTVKVIVDKERPKLFKGRKSEIAMALKNKT